jgi:hypothetical protein
LTPSRLRTNLAAVLLSWCVAATATVEEPAPLRVTRDPQGVGLVCSSHVERGNAKSTLVSASERVQLVTSQVSVTRGGRYALVQVAGPLNTLRVHAIEVPTTYDGQFVGTAETFDSSTATRIRYSTYFLHTSSGFAATVKLLMRQLPTHLLPTTDVEGPDQSAINRLFRLTTSKLLVDRIPGEVVDVVVSPAGRRAVVQITCVLSKER